MILEELQGTLAVTELSVGGTRVLLHTDLELRQGATADTLVLTSDERDEQSIVIEIPIGDAISYWQPNSHWDRTLPPDWRGRAETSLAQSSPLGCLSDHAGQTILSWALSDSVHEARINYGVSEEQQTFLIRVQLVRPVAGTSVELRLLGSGSASESITTLARWMASFVAEPPLPTPDVAREPVYSTWYSFHHEMDADGLLIEAETASLLGCGSIFIDFGWQRLAAGRRFEGCGDWVPDPVRFADFGALVDRLHALGLAVVVWVGPLLLGHRSDVFEKLAPFAPHHNRVLDAQILDPRYVEVRAFVIERLTRLAIDYRLDGLKIDFIEEAMAYSGTPSNGDVADVGEAVRLMLAGLRERLHEGGISDPLIEFRQPYISPALLPYGNVVRAADCPGDAVINRASIVDARLATNALVHSDMMMWDPGLSAEGVARHLHSSLFGVPQISIDLVAASEEHREVVRTWLALWRELRSTTLDGELRVERPHSNYPVVQAVSADRTVVGVYEPDLVVRPVGSASVVVINATTEPRLWLSMPGGQYSILIFDLWGVPQPAPDVTFVEGRADGLPVPSSGRVQLTRLS